MFIFSWIAIKKSVFDVYSFKPFLHEYINYLRTLFYLMGTTEHKTPHSIYAKAEVSIRNLR